MQNLKHQHHLQLLLYQFHESYRNKDIFGDLTGTLALDIYAILSMTLIITFFIYKTLKNKDSLKIN